MKKIMMRVLSTAVFCLIMFAFSVCYAENATYFSSIGVNGDKIVTVDYFAADGAIVPSKGNVDVSQLPNGTVNKGRICSVACYNDKIYYMTSWDGSDPYFPADIYVCNMDGSNNMKIADNCSNASNIAIVNGILYYQIYYADDYVLDCFPNFKYKLNEYTGGIMSIDVNNLTWKKMVGDCDAELHRCDEDFIYYTANSGNYAINRAGTISYPVAAFCDEFDYYWGMYDDYTYYFDNFEQLWKKHKNGYNIKTISLPDLNKNSSQHFVLCINDDYVYYGYVVFDYKNKLLVYRVNRQ